MLTKISDTATLMLTLNPKLMGYMYKKTSESTSSLPEYARLRRVATFAYANSASQSEAMREREGRRWSKQDHLVSTLATLAYEVNIVRDRYVRLTLFCSF